MTRKRPRLNRPTTKGPSLTSNLIVSRLLLAMVCAAPAASVADPACPPDNGEIDWSDPDKVVYRLGCAVGPKKKKEKDENKDSPNAPDRCIPLSDADVTEVIADVDYPSNPPIDRSKPAAYFKTKKGFAKTTGYALTVHHRESKKTFGPEPFLDGKPIWRMYPSKQGKHQCLVLEKVELVYNPITVLIASDFTPGTCADDEIIKHERKHFDFLIDLDGQYSQDLAYEIRGWGYPTPARPLMGSVENLNKIKSSGETNLRTRLDNPQQNYIDAWEAHRLATDTRQEYLATGAMCVDFPRSLPPR